MYVIRGDGVTVDHNAQVKNGILVRKTELTLGAHYEQPNVEGVAAQYIAATVLREARALTIQYEGDVPARLDLQRAMTDLPKDSEQKPLPKNELPLCQGNKQVILGTCRCSHGMYASDDLRLNRRICLSRETNGASKTSTRKETVLPAPQEETDPSKMICGY
jgi:hypothetical protein